MKKIIREIEIMIMRLSRIVLERLIKWGVFNFLDSRFRRLIKDLNFVEAIHTSIEKIFETQPGPTKWLFERYPLELRKVPDYSEVEQMISVMDINRYKTYYLESWFVRGDKQSKNELFYGTIVVDTLMNIAISRREEKTLKNFERKYQT